MLILLSCVQSNCPHTSGSAPITALSPCLKLCVLCMWNTRLIQTPLPAPQQTSDKSCKQQGEGWPARGTWSKSDVPFVAGGGWRDARIAAAPSARLQGGGQWMDPQTDRHLQKNTTNQNCGRYLIKLPFPEKLSLGKQNCLKHVHH